MEIFCTVSKSKLLHIKNLLKIIIKMQSIVYSMMCTYVRLFKCICIGYIWGDNQEGGTQVLNTVLFLLNFAGDGLEFPPNSCVKALTPSVMVFGGIWRDLWEVIGVRRGHANGALMMTSVPL